MVQFIQKLIGNDEIATVIMSLFPLIELKGGIVFARGAELSFIKALLLSYFGSTVAFIPVFFLFIPILNLLKKIKVFKTFAERIEKYFQNRAKDTVGEEKKDKVRSERFYKILGVFIFVAIPLPMTGVWTGTAIAVFLNLKFKDAILPVALGNLVAGLIVSALAQLCLTFWTIKSLDYILWGLLAVAVLFLVITLIKVAKSKDEGGKDNV